MADAVVAGFPDFGTSCTVLGTKSHQTGIGRGSSEDIFADDFERGNISAWNQPAYLTSCLLRATMHSTQPGSLISGCSTYRKVRLRAWR